MAVATYGNDWRRIGDGRKLGWIVGLSGADQAGANPRAGLDLAFRLGGGENPQFTPTATAPCKAGGAVQGLFRRTEMTQQLKECDQANVLSAAQAKSGKPLGLR